MTSVDSCLTQKCQKIYTKSVSLIISDMFDKVYSPLRHWRLKEKYTGQIFFRKLHLCQISSKQVTYARVHSCYQSRVSLTRKKREKRRSFSLHCKQVSPFPNDDCYYLRNFQEKGQRFPSLRTISVGLNAFTTSREHKTEGQQRVNLATYRFPRASLVLVDSHGNREPGCVVASPLRCSFSG